MAKVTQHDVIKFIQQQIIHKFGILQIIITDQGTIFMRDKVVTFIEEYSIKLIHLTRYYAQANG